MRSMTSAGFGFAGAALVVASIADRGQVLLVEQGEVELLPNLGRVEGHGNVDESETDVPFPDHSHRRMAARRVPHSPPENPAHRRAAIP